MTFPGIWSVVRSTLSSGVIVTSLVLSGCADGAGVTEVTTLSSFTSLVRLGGFESSSVKTVEYTVAPKPGSVSKPVHVSYSLSALVAKGYVAPNSIMLPVFGLYAGYDNQVAIEIETQAGTPISVQVGIPTSNYVDPSGVYSHPSIITSRAAGSDLGFDFIFIKSGLGSPVIIDTDSEIRWAAPGFGSAISSTFSGDEFVIGDPAQPIIYRLGLDGKITQSPLPPTTYADFHHNVDNGKQGFLGEVDATSDGTKIIESNVIEFADSNPTSILNQWDLGAILSVWMSSQGDDAAAFVRPGVDWFHSNSAIYDPTDDSIIVSSRENFVIKLDYNTGQIKWIFGDPTKYWYTFPSLRAKALTLAPGGVYPIGQHALSITSDGLLMLFNDGLGSLNQPAGAPAGETRTYSTVSAYSIDVKSMTARQAWAYDAGKTIYSQICSSAYEGTDKSILVDYAVADNLTEALLVGLDSSHNVVFEYQYPTKSCSTSWNAQPIPLDDLRVDR